MTRIEKKKFIKSLTTSVANSLISKISNMPESWDGHELRQRLADLFAYEVSDFMRKNNSRRRAYRNDVATRNI